MHQHKCSLCETMWQHGEDCDQDMREHECPACGCHQFRSHQKREPVLGALPGLLEALGNADSFVRSTTIFKLEVGDSVAHGVLPRLAELAAVDAEPLVRLAAVEALRRFGFGTAIPAITAALSDRHPEVRRAAALALGDLLPRGDPGGVGLGALTSHRDNQPRVREAIAVALRKTQPNSGPCWQVVVSHEPDA